jgi:hypothetical protein
VSRNESGIELIVPYRKNSKLRRYEDGRKLRRYKRRWIVERTNAWLGQFRRLLVRHEHLLLTDKGLLLSRLPLDHPQTMFAKRALPQTQHTSRGGNANSLIMTGGEPSYPPPLLP